MVGIKDVAEVAGVSVSTVSYVLSGKRSISAKTTNRVMEAVESLGYVPDASAKTMRGGLNHVIAIAPGRREVKHSSLSAYFMQTARRAKDAGYDVLLLTGENAVDDIKRVTSSNLADGVILLDVEREDPRAAMAGKYGKPCVAIGYPSGRDHCACVDIDFTAMGGLVAQKLFDLGHRRVALLRSVENVNEPVSGYLLLFRDAFLAKANELDIAVTESPLQDCKTFEPRKFVADCLDEDGRNGRVTAIVSQADPSVLNLVLGVFNTSGITVPADISVLSCGTLLDSQPMREEISEMPMAPAVLCREAMKILVDAIERNRDIRGVARLFDPTFVDRGSLKPIPSSQGGDH